MEGEVIIMLNPHYTFAVDEAQSEWASDTSW